MSEPISPLLQLPNTCRAFYGSFPHLYPFQKQAIEPLLQGKDLILQSATGSGKTEAVLAPCIERVIQSGRRQTALYVGAHPRPGRGFGTPFDACLKGQTRPANWDTHGRFQTGGRGIARFVIDNGPNLLMCSWAVPMQI